jgi:hypothetical protein
MKRLSVACACIALLPMTASAVCVIEPLESKLQAAETVYVGTVVKSALVPRLEQLRSAATSNERRTTIRHTVEPEIVFKGDPSTVGAVMSTWHYSDPNAVRRAVVSELTTLMPGDTILVVAESSGPARYELCTASRMWSTETEKAVRAHFSPNR